MPAEPRFFEPNLSRLDFKSSSSLLGLIPLPILPSGIVRTNDNYILILALFPNVTVYVLNKENNLLKDAAAVWQV